MREIIPASEIREIISTVKTWNPSRSDQQEPFYYIDLSSIDQQKKVIGSTSKILPKEAPSRARQLVQKGDVLVSTVRPNLNGVAYVPEKLDGATASTGFCVLRPNQKSLDGRYLFHWVQTSHFVNELVMLATGANYPAVSDRTIKTSKIPLPPLAEQKRIAAILDKADDIRHKRQASIKLADDFLRATFLEIFGDPVTNPKGWEVKPLNHFAFFENGDRSSNYPSGDDIKQEGILFISTKNILNNTFTLHEAKFITEEKFASLSRGKLKKGDLIITLRGTLGNCCIFDSEHDTGFINAQMMIIRPKKNCNNFFLHALLTSNPIQETFQQIGQGAAVPQLTGKQISELKLPFPPIGMQEKFSSLLISTTKLQGKMKNKAEEYLFNSLTQRAFRGEL